MKFTDAQQQAINHLEGNLQLIACAGSGKTEVLAQRVVTLLEDVVTDASKLVGCSVARNLGLYENLLHDKGYLDYSEIVKEAVIVDVESALKDALAHITGRTSE